MRHADRAAQEQGHPRHAGRGGVLRTGELRRQLVLIRRGERGSQTVEFALILPLLVLGVLLVVQCAALAADHVLAHTLAAQVARAHAAGSPVDADGLRQAGITLPDTRLQVSRRRVPGDPAQWIEVEVRLPSRAFRRLGLEPEVVGRAGAREQ